LRRTWEKHGQGTHLIVESRTLLGPAYADLDAPRHHAVVGLGVCQLVHVDDKFDLRTIRNAAVNVCSRHHHCGQKIADTGSLQLDDRLSPAPFPGSVRLTYGHPSSPETRPASYFPRRYGGFLADACASKYLDERVLHCVAALQVQAAGDGHLRSRIAGKWFPDETPSGDFQ
jgi:hypothetical protein